MAKGKALKSASVCGLVCGLFFWASTSASAPQSGNASYSYDGLGRVIAILYENGTGQIYSYDAAGNRMTSFSGRPVLASFSASQLSVTEGSPITLTVNRSGANVLSTVHYQTVDGSAVAGTHGNYTGVSGTLSFASGVNSLPITIQTLHDSQYDGPINFSVELLPVSANTTMPVNIVQITINDIDPPPVFSIASAGPVEEGVASTFTVTRTNPTSLSQGINYTTADNTATAGIDYSSQSGNLIFAPGATAQTVAVPTVYRSGYEGTRSLTASLSSPGAGAVIGNGSASGTITDIDPAIAFAISSPAGSVLEGLPVTFTVTASGGPPGIPFSVNYATADGSAVAGTDYTAAAGTLNFPLGTTAQTVTIPTNYSHTDSTLRTFTMTLSAASNGAPIATATGTGKIQGWVGPPMAPVITPGYQNVSSSSYSFTWSSPPGNATSYKLGLMNSDGSYSTVYSGTATGYTKNGSGDGDYTYRVQGCNSYGCGAFGSGAVTVSLGGTNQ